MSSRDVNRIFLTEAQKASTGRFGREWAGAVVAPDSRRGAGQGQNMFRKLAVILAALMVCLPITGAGITPAFSLPLAYEFHPRAEWWLGPSELATASACIVVLCLLTVHERQAR